MPQVSVIIPNYNHAKFLALRIDSILAQTYHDFELIILDDFSPDDSRDVIERYRQHPKVSQVIYNEVNGGSTFKQWKKGIDAAQGNYIWIAESDDWCEPTLLQTLMEGLLANPAAGIAYCQSCYFYEPNEVRSITHYPYYQKSENGRDFIKTRMLQGNSIVNASMAVWKRSLYASVNEEYTSFRFCGDWLFYISILQDSDIFVSGKVLNYFRNHDKDVSSGFFGSGQNYIENIRMYEILLKRQLINRDHFKKLITRQYFIYTGAKDTLAADNLPNIDQAFRKHLRLNAVTRYYYRARLKVYNLKMGLAGKN